MHRHFAHPHLAGQEGAPSLGISREMAQKFSLSCGGFYTAGGGDDLQRGNAEF